LRLQLWFVEGALVKLDDDKVYLHSAENSGLELIFPIFDPEDSLAMQMVDSWS